VNARPDPGCIPADEKHRAQLAGVLEAYLPKGKEAYEHTVEKLIPGLLDGEDILAGTTSFRGWTLREGLLVVTSLRLMWTKQSFFRRRPTIVAYKYSNLRQVEFYFDDEWHRPALRVETSATPDGAPPAIFTFLEETFDGLPAIAATLRRILGERFVDRTTSISDPKDPSHSGSQ
jgi:hypothetical protein